MCGPWATLIWPPMAIRVFATNKRTFKYFFKYFFLKESFVKVKVRKVKKRRKKIPDREDQSNLKNLQICNAKFFLALMHQISDF